MNNLHLGLVLTFIVFAVICTKPVDADPDLIKILDVQVQPSTIKVNNTFSVSATILNNSTYSVYLTSGSCVPAFSVEFDSHVKQVHPDIACTLEELVQRIDPNVETTISSVNKPGTIYESMQTGTANGNITIPYFIKNQTATDDSNIYYNVSKSFQFQVYDTNETKIGNQLPIGNPFKPSLDSPLKQFKSGIPASDVKCESNLLLVIKSSDNSPVCTKPQTALILLERDWGNISSPFDTNVDLLDSKISGGKIIGFHYDLHAKIVLVKLQTPNDGNLKVTIPRQLLDANTKGHDESFVVLCNGKQADFAEINTTNSARTLAISFENETAEIEILGNFGGQQASS
jgi:hypothetical protein